MYSSSVEGRDGGPAVRDMEALCLPFRLDSTSDPRDSPEGCVADFLRM